MTICQLQAGVNWLRVVMELANDRLSGLFSNALSKYFDVQRKPEDEESEAAAENKKIRQERGGGDAKGSPCDQNGHEQVMSTPTKKKVELRGWAGVAYLPRCC